jgi:hypothetical protein
MTNELFPACPEDQYELFFEVPGLGEIKVFVSYDYDDDEDQASAEITAAFDDNGLIELTGDQQSYLEDDALELIGYKIRAKALHDHWDDRSDYDQF